MEEIFLLTGDATEFIEVTSEVVRIVENSGVKSGLCTIYIPHTTAGITINESNNYRIIDDMLNMYNNVIPNYRENEESVEGNSAAHIKASLIGSSENIIISDGKLQMGDWQGIYLAEFSGPRDRRILVNILEAK